ncbi:Lrp/AsnC family transcriptional regulator [Arthrobacter sp. UM1]|uniref:Lrp/AsnC family transcriptional regulator n=1 Tax=Arthrobacter sp. UM1 TaxID=2766776 RepID=UPI001CF66B58|nr:Lrp/AsnC family transcriptional regulator [Arthrobacter sp. UM1]MCB4207366.1 Lrp/AsnC family transcriptional regulator [Arthrobacter sp. UM1]
MASLTDLDHRLLAALRRDGRAPIAALAEELGVSRATVTKRIDSLTNRGVIVGFTVRVRDDADAEAVRAVCMLQVERQTTDQVIARLSGVPEISALHTTNGNWDLVAEVRCESLGAFDALLRRLRGIEGIVGSETSLLLSSVMR